MREGDCTLGVHLGSVVRLTTPHAVTAWGDAPIAGGLHGLELWVFQSLSSMSKAPFKTPASYEAALEELE